VKSQARTRAGKGQRHVVVVGDTVVSEEGMATLVGRNPRYRVCGTAHSFHQANEVVRQERPDLLLIDPFLENRDGIRWIKDLATEFPRTRILIATRESEQTYAERALRAGAWGYWMRNGPAEELFHAIETVLAGEVYVSPVVTSHAMHKFAGHRDVSHRFDVLSDREMAVFALIAAGHGTGQIAKELSISRKTVETHCEHIKLKLAYTDAEALHHGARESLGRAEHSLWPVVTSIGAAESCEVLMRIFPSLVC
jgi:DNA-binding NarL/FixJ family response regulator